MHFWDEQVPASCENATKDAEEMVHRTLREGQPFQDIKVFHDVARALTSSLDLDSILGAIMEQMQQFFEPESWSLLIVDVHQQNLYYAVAARESANGDKNARIPLGEGIAGWVALHGESLIVPEVEDAQIDIRGANPEASSLRSVIC